MTHRGVYLRIRGISPAGKGIGPGQNTGPKLFRFIFVGNVFGEML